MDQAVLRQISRILTAYLHNNTVPVSELPKLVEIVGAAVVKANDAEQKLGRSAQASGPAALIARDLLLNPTSEARSTSSGVSRSPSRDDMDLARHIGLLTKILSERERLGTSERVSF